MNDTRKCPQCERAVWYGIYCSNVCSDKAYRQWRRDNPDMVDICEAKDVNRKGER